MYMKSILMDEKIHAILKSYCVENGLVMKKLLEKIIIDEVTKKHHNQTTIVKKYQSYEG
jgi:hypothetical protein